MALSQGKSQGWYDVAQPQTPAPLAAPSHLEAREGPAPAQWQAVKEEIRILYEKKPLKDVRKILEQRRGFRATERMYKARLSQWGFSKNYSDRDYQICAVLHYIRLKSRKQATAFVIHGHKRSLKDLHKYIKGRKMSEDDFLATALKNIHCRSQAEQEQEQQYAHVRAYTPAPEAEVEEDAPTKGLAGEIAANTAKASPPGAEPVSGSCSTSTTHRDSPTSTSQKPSPHDNLSPAFWSPFEAQLTPSTQHNSATQSPPRQNVSITWPRSAGSQLNTSPGNASSAANNLSYAYSPLNQPLESLDDQIRYAGYLHNNSSPTMSCQRLGRDVEYMALQLVDSPSLKSLCGHDDIDSWRLMYETSPQSSDFEQTCPTCNKYTKDHFISLPNLELPQKSRNILNDTSDVPQTAIQVPGSSRDHEHSWKWVARCFSACIYLKRGDDTLSRKSLADANEEFEQMLVPQQDPKILLALNQTLQILHMHDEDQITRTIMNSAYEVAVRVLGQHDPLTVIVRWMVLVADLKMKTGEIPSEVLQRAYEQFVQRYGETDSRSIAAQYCYGYMLNVERNVQQAEQVLRRVYSVSSAVLGRKHLQSISALTNLQRAVARQGRTDEAIELLRRAIDDSIETLGTNHPRRLESMRLLAKLYEEQGRLDLTEHLYWTVLEGRIKMLGKNHSYTQGMKVDLETLLKKVGKWGTDQPLEDNQEENKARRGKGKEKVPHTRTNSRDAMEVSETPEQLRLQDLFEWDPNEKWDSPGSRGRGRSNTQNQLDLESFIGPTPTVPQDISSGWDPMDADARSLVGSDDSGSQYGAF